MNSILDKIKGRYLCPLCPARFAELGDKRRHLKAEHPKQPKR